MTYLLDAVYRLTYIEPGGSHVWLTSVKTGAQIRARLTVDLNDGLLRVDPHSVVEVSPDV